MIPMQNVELVRYLLEGTEGSNVTKTDVFLNALMRKAANRIIELEDKVIKLEREKGIVS